MTAVLPLYYLTHDTPQGPRFAYPVPALEGWPGYPLGAPSVTWTAPGTTISVAGKWLVTDNPLREVTASWLPSKRPDGWRKCAEGPEGVFVRPAWVDAPAEPTTNDVEHWNSHNSEDCLRCQVFLAINELVYTQPPAEIRTVDFTAWVPLPGTPDPDPERQWILHDTSMIAIYGDHTAHLWPGYLSGFRDRVYALLKADPRVQHVFNGNIHRDQPAGSLQTTVPIKWDTPKTKIRSRTGATGQKLRGKVEVPDPIAHSAQTTLMVPTGVTGATKADALARWDSELARWVELLVPDVVACNHCDGHGHLLARDSAVPGE